MTQTRWRITTALLLSALVVGASRGEEKPTPEQAPKKDCPVLSKIPYLKRLFKDASAPPTTSSAACPCKPDEPSDGCCCSESKDKPAMRCCPVTGVCCPVSPRTAHVPSPCPPPAPVCTPLPPPAIAVQPPPPFTMPVPPMGPYPFAPTPMPMPPYGMAAPVPPPPIPPDGKMYIVELKVSEPGPGGDEKVLTRPELMVTAGEPGYVTCGPSIEVRVVPAGRHGRVLLDVSVEKAEQKRIGREGFVEQMNAIHVCKRVKLGKVVKLHGNDSTSEAAHFHIEATVKESSPSHDVAVYAPPMMPMCSEPCPCPTPMDAPVCSPVTPVDCCLPAPTPCRTVAVKKPFQKTTLSVSHSWDGTRRVEVRSGDACVRCEKTELSVHGRLSLEVAVVGDQLSLTRAHYPLKAKADHVSTAPNGFLLLEGHVHVEGAGKEDVIEVQGGKVRLKLPEALQTFVPSSPTLVQ
jgi:hypothetical protein